MLGSPPSAAALQLVCGAASGQGVTSGSSTSMLLLERHIPLQDGSFHVSDEEADRFLASRSIAQRFVDWSQQRQGTKAVAFGAAELLPGHRSREAAPYHPTLSQVRLAAYQRAKYGNNSIRSARYTMLTFLPLNLWEQLTPSVLSHAHACTTQRMRFSVE